MTFPRCQQCALFFISIKNIKNIESLCFRHRGGVATDLPPREKTAGKGTIAIFNQNF